MLNSDFFFLSQTAFLETTTIMLRNKSFSVRFEPLTQHSADIYVIRMCRNRALCQNDLYTISLGLSLFCHVIFMREDCIKSFNVIIYLKTSVTDAKLFVGIMSAINIYQRR